MGGGGGRELGDREGIQRQKTKNSGQRIFPPRRSRSNKRGINVSFQI